MTTRMSASGTSAGHEENGVAARNNGNSPGPSVQQCDVLAMRHLVKGVSMRRAIGRGGGRRAEWNGNDMGRRQRR